MKWHTAIDPSLVDFLLDSFSEGIYITNPEGMTLGVNKAYEEITTIDGALLVGRYMHEIVSDGILSSTITEEVIRTGETVSSDQKTFSGKRCFITARPIKDSNGTIILVVTVVRDVAMIDTLQSELKKQQAVASQYKRRLEEIEPPADFVVQSKAFCEAVSLSRRVAPMDSTVLILGESGTGKELIAREIYENSSRTAQPFIKINCGTIPENLLESELFGYEKGSFTGALPGGHIGMFEVADKGTLFLDEIGDLPLSLQGKLLRVLQEKTIMRIGSAKEIRVNTRVIAATHENLERMVLEKRFRQDLYYRLNVVHIDIPPLRERMDAVPGLIDFFVAKINDRYGLRKKLHPDRIKDMMTHNWPGNVRELEHAVERMMVTSESDIVTGPYKGRLASLAGDGLTISGLMPLQEAQSRVEKYLVQEAGKRFKTTYQIARALQISQPSASRKVKKHNGPAGD